MKNMEKKLISLVLCVAMMINIFPANVLAESISDVTSYQPTDQELPSWLMQRTTLQ